MAVSKRWHIALSSTESSKPVNLSLPKKMGLTLLILAISLLLLFAGSIYYIIQNNNKIVKAKQILNENKQLKNKIYSLSSQIDSVMAKIKLMEEWEDKIRSDKNFKTINKEIRKMGIGGLPHVDTTFTTQDEKLSLDYSLTLNKLIQLSSKTSFNYKTHEELLDQVNLKKLLYRNTPSIYPTYGRITDAYGWRIHPISKKKSFHRGLDFGNIKGIPIYSTADGVVKATGRLNLFGKYVAIGHKFGYQTNFAHLDKIYVKKGDKVKRGQIIAELGNTGRSTGAHLHYEVLRYNKYRNPYKYLNKLEDDIILSHK